MFAVANLQLYLAEHLGLCKVEDIPKLMQRAVDISGGGNCVAEVAYRVLGDELGAAFLAETASDLRHMLLWSEQMKHPDVVLVLGVEPKRGENTEEEPSSGGP